MATKQTGAYKTATGADVRIVVLKERWQLIGEYHPSVDGKPAWVENAACIRLWGTTKGLGEIAMHGPTKETVLDHCGIVVLDSPSAVLYTIKCTF